MGGAGNRTILLVEDYKDSREMIRFLLEDLGYRIMEARNGKEALDLASREIPDLVLTDFNLPDIDGTTLIKRLRTLDDKTAVYRSSCSQPKIPGNSMSWPWLPAVPPF